MRPSTPLIVGFVLLTAGCHQPIRPAEPVAQRVAIHTDDGMDLLWESAKDELRRNRFELNFVDRRSGTITTYPVTSQSFFEFWRHDVDTAYDLMESTLRTVRRSAVVKLDREPAATEATITVTVHRERFTTPERQFNSSASTLRIFGDSLPGVRGERLLTRADDYWIPDGRDANMERRLLERILSRAVLSATPAAAESNTP